MARIRTIKPEFWTDEKIGALKREERLLFIGLWNLADGEGVVKSNPVFLKSSLFPYDDDLRVTTVTAWLNNLKKARMLIPFTHNGEGYFYIRTFLDHQVINRPSKSRWPKGFLQNLVNQEVESTHGTLTEPSLWEQETGNREREQGKEETTAPGKPAGVEEIKTDPLKTEKNSQQPQGTPRRELLHPFSLAFEDHWARWLKYKKEQRREKYKSEESERLAIKRLVDLSGGDEARAVAHIDHAIGQTWKGFYPIKDNNNGFTQNRQPTASGGGAAKGNSAGAAMLASLVREQLTAASGA